LRRISIQNYKGVIIIQKDKYVYPAIFSYDNDGISVEFPDLPGCYTCAENTDEAIMMAQRCYGFTPIWYGKG